MTYLVVQNINFKSEKVIYNFLPFKENSSMKKKYQTKKSKEFLKTVNSINRKL